MTVLPLRSSDPDITKRLINLIRDLSVEEKQALLEQLESKSSKDRRKGKRKPFLALVDYATPERFFRDFIRNIGEGGVFIETRESFLVGDQIFMTFQVPGFHAPIKIAGEVVWMNQDGLGIKFNMANKLQKKDLLSVLEKI